MKTLILVILSVISAATCNEFIVLNAPKSLEFKGSSDLPSESLSEVLATSLGFSVYPNSAWNGLYVNDPFNLAKSVVTVVVEGSDGLTFQDAKTFNLVGDAANFEDEFLTKVMDHSRLAINVNLIDNDVVSTPFGKLEKTNVEDEVQFLKPKTNKKDKEFLNQIAYLQSLIKLFTEGKEKPTALNARVSLKMLSKNSEASSEALKLLTSTIKKLNAAVEKSYDGNALFAVIVEANHNRVRRQAEPNTNPYNLAEPTDPDYPVVFNIMLWFTIIFVFTLLAISLSLSNVEDKDSIIYRMTGARGKKDN